MYVCHLLFPQMSWSVQSYALLHVPVWLYSVGYKLYKYKKCVACAAVAVNTSWNGVWRLSLPENRDGQQRNYILGVGDVLAARRRDDRPSNHWRTSYRTRQTKWVHSASIFPSNMTIKFLVYFAQNSVYDRRKVSLVVFGRYAAAF